MTKKVKELKPDEILSALRVHKGIPFKTNDDTLTDDDAEKLLTKKITLGEAFDMLDVVLIPTVKQNQEAYHAHKVLEFVLTDFLKKEKGLSEKDIDKLFQKAEKEFSKEQEDLKKKRDKQVSEVTEPTETSRDRLITFRESYVMQLVGRCKQFRGKYKE